MIEPSHTTEIYMIAVRDEKNERVLLLLDYKNKLMPININQAEPYRAYKVRSGTETYFQIGGKRMWKRLDLDIAQELYKACNQHDISGLLTVDTFIQENLGDIICQEIPLA